MDAEANQHGTETPSALPSHRSRANMTALDEAATALASGTDRMSQAASNALDGSAVDKAGVDAGTRSATRAYSTEEMAATLE